MATMLHYLDSRPLEKMEIDSITTKTRSLEAIKASETQAETQIDPKLPLKDTLVAIITTI